MSLNFIQKQSQAAATKNSRHLVARRDYGRRPERQKRLEILKRPGVVADMRVRVDESGRKVATRSIESLRRAAASVLGARPT
jgi:hypothetical protein